MYIYNYRYIYNYYNIYNIIIIYNIYIIIILLSKGIGTQEIQCKCVAWQPFIYVYTCDYEG